MGVPMDDQKAQRGRTYIVGRRGGRFEAAGFLLILGGLGMLYAGWATPLWGAALAVGFLVFLAGRFM